MCALGLAATRVCATTDAASVVGPFTTLILAFISGVFIPSSVMPAWLPDPGKLFPLEHLARGLQEAFAFPGSTGVTAVAVVGGAQLVVAGSGFGRCGCDGRHGRAVADRRHPSRLPGEDRVAVTAGRCAATGEAGATASQHLLTNR